MRDPATLLGTSALAFIREVGAMTSFLFEVIWQAFKNHRGRLILEQMEFVGVGSLFIALDRYIHRCSVHLANGRGS